MILSLFNRLASQLQHTLSDWLERLRKFVMRSRAKDFVLLALPYQVSAILTALVAVGYAKLFAFMEARNLQLLAHDPRWIFLSAPISFLLSWWLVMRFAPLAGGSGIPQLMAAVEVSTENDRDRSWRFLNVRIILVKIASSLAMVGGGGAVGREGPTLQIAGSIYRTVHKLLPPFWPRVSRRVMMVTGGAAGLSAAFNTPLGGIVFAVEELTKTHIAQFRTAVLTAVILSGMTAQWLMGPYLFLGYPKLEPATFSFMYKILGIALVCGISGAVFCKVLMAFDKLRRSFTYNWAQAIFAVCCAMLFALTYYWLGAHTLASGKVLLEEYLFAPQVDPTSKDVAARLLGPLFTSSAGGAGGIFAPSLSAGAAIGGWIAQWFEPTRGQFNLLVVCGMAAFLTGVTRSPFTSAILVLEMTDRHSAIFQLMYASMVGYLIAYVIDRKSYYERMKDRLLRALPDWSPEPEPAADPYGERTFQSIGTVSAARANFAAVPPPTPGFGAQSMKQYHDLLRHILDHGVRKKDRTGTGTLSCFGYQMRFDLAEGFPLLTTKKLHTKSIIHELLWFLQGDTNIKYLQDNGVKIWDEWADAEGNLGPVYGYQWRNWPTPNGGSIDQITKLVEMIKRNPDSRRLIVTAWNPSDVERMALPPCHCLFQFYVADGKLSCQLYQRSADTFLGVPFNIASYALLTLMVAQVCGLKPGEFIHTFGDVHLYADHLEQARLQLTRECRPLPTMELDPTVTDLFAFRFEHFTLKDYDPHPHIKAAVSV